MKWLDWEKNQRQVKKEYKYYKIYMTIVFKNLMQS